MPVCNNKKNQMIKSIFNICLTILLTSTALSAQNFQGKAIYQSKATMDIDFSSTQMPADRVARIKESMKNNLEKTYELTFDQTASIYKEVEKLDQTSNGGGRRMGFFMMMGGSGATGKYYKNIQTKKLVKENEFSDKKFLIKDDLKAYEWKMAQETKMIGEKMCFKATTIVEMPERREIQFGRRPQGGQAPSGNEAQIERKMEPVIVTAWYTLDIPVNHGPGDYWGLPGLILELSYADTKIMCTKIVINAKDKMEIKEPAKGKVITQEAYDELIEKKRNEMRERMRSERQKGGAGSGRRGGH